MTAPILALRAALNQVLSDIGLTVYDEAQNSTLPYASFGECSVRLWTDGATNVAEHRISIHIWSRAPGDSEALDLLGRIAAQIEATKPPATAIPLIHWTIAGHDMARPTREGIRRATLRVTAISEHQKGIL